jgi:hypothetical protein
VIQYLLVAGVIAVETLEIVTFCNVKLPTVEVVLPSVTTVLPRVAEAIY